MLHNSLQWSLLVSAATILQIIANLIGKENHYTDKVNSGPLCFLVSTFFLTLPYKFHEVLSQKFENYLSIWKQP